MKFTKFTPHDTKLLIQPLEGQDKTDGGILLTDAAKSKKPIFGHVIAVGEGAMKEDGTRFPMTTQLGQLVMYSKYGGSEVTINGIDMIVLTDDQIYGHLE